MQNHSIINHYRLMPLLCIIARRARRTGKTYADTYAKMVEAEDRRYIKRITHGHDPNAHGENTPLSRTTEL